MTTRTAPSQGRLGRDSACESRGPNIWDEYMGRQDYGGGGPEELIALPARDLREILTDVTWSRRRPLVRSDVELRPRTTHGSLGPKGSCSRRLLEGGRRPAAPAARSRPADPIGSGGRRCVSGHAGRSRQCAVADGAVIQSGRGRPGLVKPVLHTDMVVCMSQRPPAPPAHGYCAATPARARPPRLPGPLGPATARTRAARSAHRPRH
jgi:hypothetical protein